MTKVSDCLEPGALGNRRVPSDVLRGKYGEPGARACEWAAWLDAPITRGGAGTSRERAGSDDQVVCVVTNSKDEA